jgi:hypothetical protein
MGRHSVVPKQRTRDDLDVQPCFLANLPDRCLGEGLSGQDVARG